MGTVFFSVIILGALWLAWILLRSRMEQLEERIVRLETELAELRTTPPADVTTPEPPAVEPARVEPPTREDQPAELPPPLPAFARYEATPAPTTPEPPTATVPEPLAPSLSERIREKLGEEEWEALVGGSLLNKLGALILVIGIALFLAYSFTRMGPLGRAATGLAVSLAMLGAGIWIERRERYRVFSRGLMGGGWAALYFTVYAMHDVVATKVIDSPLLGGMLLFAVAAGMIAQSLKYRSQALTALAYFIAFATLAITPVTAFSVIALVPLAGSLLAIAVLFQWSTMALFGLLATWGTLVSRGDSNAPLWQVQALFLIYWMLFEAFDLLRARRRVAYEWWESLVEPLNAVAFGALTYLKWRSAAPEHVYFASAGVAGLYLASALLRARLLPPADLEGHTWARILNGGYEGPITIAAALSAAAVLFRFHGPTAAFGLLGEAECLFLAGLFFAQPYLRQLAAALFVADGVVLLTSPSAGWSWPALAGAALFYLNRFLERGATAYGFAGAAAAALWIGLKSPEAFLGAAWLGLAVALFGFGFLRRLQDFRLQAYCVSGLALAATGFHQANVAAGAVRAARFSWLTLSGSALAAYAAVWTALRCAEDRLGGREREVLRSAASWATSALLATLAWRVLPVEYMGLGWLALSLLLLELGLRRLPPEFRTQAAVLFALGSGATLVLNIIPVENVGPLTTRMIPAGCALAAYAFAVRLKMRAEPPGWITASAGAGTLFCAVGLWALLPPVAVGPAWAALAVVLVEAGLVGAIGGVESQGHILAAATLIRLFAANFVNDGATGFVSHRLLTVLPVAAGFYHLWSRLGEKRIARYYVHAAALLVVALMRFELGRTYAVAGWSAFAVFVLLAGRRMDNRDLCRQSYVVAGLAFLRGMISSFNAPESLSGSAGRIGVAAFVIACLYAAQLIAQRDSRPRVYFSLLATVLLSVLLEREVSGGMLTVAWGLEGIALLIAGFPLRDRALRLSGLFLFLVCVLKLFLYDLRNLETMNRILSFIVLGLLLIGVSWLYTRFRDRIQKFL